MSTQIAIRLPEELVEHLDEQVRKGVAGNRTEVIRRLLARELRRTEIEAELEALEQPWDDPDDLAGLAAWAGRQSPPLAD